MNVHTAYCYVTYTNIKKDKLKMNEYRKIADSAKAEGFVAGCIFMGLLWYFFG